MILVTTVVICAITAPRIAWAAMSLQCADSGEPVFASLLDEASSEAADSATAATESETIDINGTPMSLAEGASAVAPQPIDGPSDARIEAAKRCQQEVGMDEIQAPSDNAPLPELASVMAAVLPTPLVLPTAGPLDKPRVR